MRKAGSLVSGSGASPSPYVKLLVADEFRSEQNGKVLAIGLYSDGVVVLTIPKNSPPPTKETPYGIDGLSLLITVGGFVGETVIKFGIKGGKVLEHPVSMKPGQTQNLILNLKPFRTFTFGQKTVLVDFGGTHHEMQFEVRANYIEAVEDLDQYIDIVPTLVKLPAPTTPKVKPVAKKARVKKPPAK